MSARVVLVDDERLARVALRKLLEQQPGVVIVGEARSAREAAELIKQQNPDVIFLDVEMPGGSGFTLFDKVSVEAHVVFVTGFDEYAVRAFEVNALDYLVKPVSPKNVARVFERIASGEASSAGHNTLTADDVVCLAEQHAMKFARVSEITHIAAADDYSEVHLVSGRVSLVNVRLKQWEERLPPNSFARSHRSMLVNLTYVDEVVHKGGRWVVRMRNLDTRLPMSRRFAHALRTKLRLGG